MSSIIKTPMMLRYEAETSKPSINVVTDGVHVVGIEVWHWEYIAWLEYEAIEKENALMKLNTDLLEVKEIIDVLGRKVGYKVEDL